MQVHWGAGYRSARDGATEDQKKLYAKEDWPTDGLNPDTNIKYGSGYLKIVYDQWKDSFIYNDPVKNAISAYNKGRTLGPDLGNQASYVDPILTYYENYKNKFITNPTQTPTSSSGEDPRIAKAIGWAEKQIGSKEYYHDGYFWCLDFVEDAYETGAESAPARPWSNAKEAANGLNAKNNKVCHLVVYLFFMSGNP